MTEEELELSLLVATERVGELEQELTEAEELLKAEKARVIHLLRSTELARDEALAKAREWQAVAEATQTALESALELLHSAIRRFPT